MQKSVFYAVVALATSLPTFGATASASLAPASPTAVATGTQQMEIARQGADDANRNERHGRGRDDGRNHAENIRPEDGHSAGHGADDGPNHDRGDDRGGDRGGDQGGDHGGHRGRG
ncbi:MAG: hypothetical protein KGI75_14475 [Rhizobiaceae bacterium]|nr:hypothetical protein [Rhizobiaceae bacterium]